MDMNLLLKFPVIVLYTTQGCKLRAQGFLGRFLMSLSKHKSANLLRIALLLRFFRITPWTL